MASLGCTRSAPSAISINTCYNTNDARTFVGGGVGRSRLRIVIVIINDWIYERILEKIIIVRYSFDESTALWLQTTNKRAKSS